MSLSLSTAVNLPYVFCVSQFLHTHTNQYSLEVTNGLRAAFPVVVEKINGIESSPFEYKVNGSEVRIGFILHSDDEKTAYSGESGF